MDGLPTVSGVRTTLIIGSEQERPELTSSTGER